jgi:hypothetical protein
MTGEDREIVELPDDRVERFYRILLGEWARIRDWHQCSEDKLPAQHTRDTIPDHDM